MNNCTLKVKGIKVNFCSKSKDSQKAQSKFYKTQILFTYNITNDQATIIELANEFINMHIRMFYIFL